MGSSWSKETDGRVETVDELKTMYAQNVKSKRIERLAISDFKQEISTRCKSFHPNTRQWILNQVKSHVESHQPESCIMLITAGPGMGKSTLAAKVCQMYKDLECLGGCHFFQFSNSTRNNPRLMLQSIARQMCDTVPAYKEALEEKLKPYHGKEIKEMNCEELLTVLLEEPFCNLEQTYANFVVVIDALDECSYDLKNELMTALRNKLSCLPSWLRFIITSRPSTNTSVLGSTVAVELNPDNQYNLQDLESFFCYELELKTHFVNNHNEVHVQSLVQITQGLFLMAFFILDFLKTKTVASPSQLCGLFPNGISSVYENYFSSLKEILLPFISEEKGFSKVLKAFVAAENVLPKNMVYDILGLKRDVPPKKKQARTDALNSLHFLFPIEDDHVTAFHKSVVDWLILEGDEEHDFSVRVEDGNEVLANQCYDVLSDIRNGKKDLDKPLDLTDSEKYALRFGWQHIKESTTISETKKVGIWSNLYILAVIVCEWNANNDYSCSADFMMEKIEKFFSNHERMGENSSDPLFQKMNKLIAILCHSQDTFRYNIFHDTICPRIGIHHTFGNCLEFVLQAAHAVGLTEETTPKPLDALKEYNFPYFHTNTVLRKPVIIQESNITSLRTYDINLCEGGFIVSYCNIVDTKQRVISKYKLDGNSTGEGVFDGTILGLSPKNQFMVFINQGCQSIEVIDVKTLAVVSKYTSPHAPHENVMLSGHVFGKDDRCWYIVLKCRWFDDKVYVIDGLTGHLHKTIVVRKDDQVMGVGKLGHIVLSRIWDDVEIASSSYDTLTDRRSNGLEIMNWKKHCYPDHLPLLGMAYSFHTEDNTERQTIVDRVNHASITYREISICHYKRKKKRIPVYPPPGNVCNDSLGWSFDSSLCKDVQFSEDGHLFTYYYKDSIFIVKTSDGSLFKRCSFGNDYISDLRNILLVSERHLIMSDINFLIFVNLQTNQVEHRIHLKPFVNSRGKITPYPKKAGQPFTFLLEDSGVTLSDAWELLVTTINNLDF